MALRHWTVGDAGPYTVVLIIDLLCGGNGVARSAADEPPPYRRKDNSSLCSINGVTTSGAPRRSPTGEKRYFDSLPIEGKVARANLFEFTD